MKREWKPGDVAMVTDPVYGERVALFVAEDGCHCWHIAIDDRLRCLDADQALGAHPLVAIDPEDREQVERLTTLFLNQFPAARMPEDDDAMQAALREFADPKPPKHRGGDSAPTVETVDLLLAQLRRDRDASGYWQERTDDLAGAEVWLESLRDWLGGAS